MTWGPADKLDRTAKLLIDSGKAADPIEAAAYLRGLVLQVAVGAEIADQAAAQAALATAVNAGSRAFRGGVHVYVAADRELDTGWTAGLTASEVVGRYGGTVVDQLDPNRPTLVIGHPEHCIGKPLLHCTWQGWSGGIVLSAEDALTGDGIVLAGILAAALGVSEVFQQEFGFVEAGRRDVGISLWSPDVDWRTAEPGPALEFLPAALWLLGLGHLGQAYAWAVGMLPYAQPADVEIGLLDFDVAVDGNRATQLLVTAPDVDKRKTRIVSAALEGLGMRTRLVERAFDEHFHAVVHGTPTRNEPTTALAGFDSIQPRRDLGTAKFTHVIDAGLGAGPVEYLDMVVQTFPDAGEPASAFREDPRSRRSLGNAYEREIARQVEAGTDETAARCGMLEIAGVTVGAAFVGAVAGTLVVADLLRLLHDGRSYSVIALDLRRPGGIKAVVKEPPVEHVLPRFTRAR